MIKNNIKRVRENLGLSQRDLALLLGVSQQQISQWEDTSKLPKFSTLDNLSRALNCSLSDLLGTVVYIIDNLSNEMLGYIEMLINNYKKDEKL